MIPLIFSNMYYILVAELSGQEDAGGTLMMARLMFICLTLWLSLLASSSRCGLGGDVGSGYLPHHAPVRRADISVSFVSCSFAMVISCL